MDYRYLKYCRRDSVFYREPLLRADSMSLLEGPRPASWLWGRLGDWEFWSPQDATMRTHGWKIHVSTAIGDAGSTLKAVSDICVETETPFKFIPTMAELLSRNAKSADRSASGKFITIYPHDDDALSNLASRIDRSLAGRPAPYILSDVRLRQGPVFFRFGGFLDLSVPGPNDQDVAVIPAEHGRLVPDVRGPVFVVPDHAHVPPLVREAIEAYEGASAPSPLDEFISLAPLHFSNSGGVYLGTRNDGSKSILKEARPHAGLDYRGRDAIHRLRAEAATLDQLAQTGLVPRLLACFTAWEHEFLEMEYVEGTPLADWTVRNFPFRREDPTHATHYATLAGQILSSLGEALRRIHDTGAVIGDLHPGNVIVREDLSVRIIDFEDGRTASSTEPPAFNVLGYRAPDHYSPMDADWYAASRVAASMFIIDFVLEVLAPSHWQRVVARVASEFGADAASHLSKLAPSDAAAPKRELLYRPDDEVRSLHRDQRLRPALEPFIGALIDGIKRTYLASPGVAFPGDIAQYEGLGRLNIATGAAGVLLTLQRAGAHVPESAVDALDFQARSVSTNRLGLFDGLAGIASALAELGRIDTAVRLLQIVATRSTTMRRLDLYGGLSGIGSALVAAHQVLPASDEFLDRAIDIASTLESRLLRSGNSESVEVLSARGGLLYGWSGVSLFFSHLANSTGDGRLVDLARETLQSDLAFVSTGSTGSLGVIDEEHHRSLPYLAWGSAGILVALDALRKFDGHEQDFAERTEGLIRACTGHTYAFAGLFNGRAGIISGLVATHSGSDEWQRRIDLQLNRIHDLALEWEGTLQFAGENYLRLSADLSTGSAGVLAAALSVRDRRPAWLPVVTDGSTDFDRTRSNPKTNLKEVI